MIAKVISKKKTVTVIALAVISLGFVVYGNTRYPNVENPEIVQEKPIVVPKTVSLAKVDRENVCPNVTYPGMVQAFETAKLSFRVGGPLVEIKVKPGDRVKKGDVLMQIDPRDFINEVESIEAQIQAAKARLSAMKDGARPEDIKLLEATLQSARSKAEFAETEYERFRTLNEKHAVSDSEHDLARDNMINAQMALSRAEQELEKGRNGERKEDISATEADIRNMEVALQIARDRLEDTTLRAAFDGIVTNRSIENHEMVTTSPSNREVLALHDISRLKIRVFLPDKELLHRQLSENFEADIRFSVDSSRSFRANLYEIDTQPNETSGLYAVTFVLDAPDGINILPGMVAEATINADESRRASHLLVSADAVLSTQDGRYYVWTIDPESFIPMKREIRRGCITRDNRYIVLEGLKEGEQVVVKGGRFLSEGMQVALQN